MTLGTRPISALGAQGESHTAAACKKSHAGEKKGGSVKDDEEGEEMHQKKPCNTVSRGRNFGE